MTCREFTEVLDDLVDGLLPLATAARARAHAGECPDCRNYRESYLSVIRLAPVAFLRAADHDASPDDAESLVATILVKARATDALN